MEEKNKSTKKSTTKKTTSKPQTTRKSSSSKTTKSTKPAAKTSTSTKTSKVAKTTKPVTKSSSKTEKELTTKKVETKAVKEIDVKVEEKEEKITSSNNITVKNELKRLYVVLGFIGVLVLIGIFSAMLSISKSSKIISKVEELKTSLTEQIVYITKTGCGYCELNENNMQSLKNQYDIEYYEVNISKLTKDDISKLIYILELDASDFGTPTISIVKNGSTVQSLSGIQTYDTLFSLLKANNLIKEDATLYLNYINYEGYKNLLTTTENEVLVLASSTCHYCLEERPVLDEIAKETGAKINWIYLDRAFNSEEEYNEFMESLEWIKENPKFGTPTTLIINNGEVKSALTGYRQKTDLINYYTQNNIIK